MNPAEAKAIFLSYTSQHAAALRQSRHGATILYKKSDYLISMMT